MKANFNALANSLQQTYVSTPTFPIQLVLNTHRGGLFRVSFEFGKRGNPEQDLALARQIRRRSLPRVLPEG